jgi:hypothetical protein
MPETRKGERATQASRAGVATAHPPALSPTAALIDIADTLYRTAADACTEHRRYADMVERAVPESEQKTSRHSVRICDEALDEATDLYEIACLEETNHADDAWWHKANMMWRAAKEFLRHHATSDRLTRGGQGHGRAELMELSIEYKLEASALLRLRHTIDAYAEIRPEAMGS